MSDYGSEEEEELGPSIGEYDGDRNELQQRHGKGKALLPNGDVYEGEYKYGRRHGRGVYKYKRGRGARYEGQWYMGRKYGSGTFYYPDGSRYDGHWQDNKRHGFGTYTYTNGDVYEGYWENNVRQGQGLYIHKASGAKHMGNWEGGHKLGDGMLITGERRYMGNFKNNLPEGPGQYVFPLLECQQAGTYEQVLAPTEDGEVNIAPGLVTQLDEGEEGEEMQEGPKMMALWKTNAKATLVFPPDAELPPSKLDRPKTPPLPKTPPAGGSEQEEEAYQLLLDVAPLGTPRMTLEQDPSSGSDILLAAD